jgi:peptide/nickel transport system substrate-binding protein
MSGYRRAPLRSRQGKELIKAYGKPVNVKYMVTAETRGLGVGQIFQEFWKAAGITVTLDPVDQTTFVTKSLAHDFDIGGWRIIDLADPEPQTYANFHTGSPVNIGNYANPAVDQLLEEARSIGDPEKRTEEYCRIAQILNTEVPWIWTLDNHYFNIAKAQLKGVHKQFSDTIDVADAWWDKK